MPLPSGTVLLNRYRIVSILGQGGMGAVYRAQDEHLGIPVAVKENLFLTDEYSRQFQREARILASMRHPNLPHVGDYFVLEGQGQYLVMDYIEGEDLRQRMERLGPLSERDTILIGISICDALDHLHTRNPSIIHRDVKPGNIKVTGDGQAVLVDFGLAKVMQGSQATMTGARAMTPGYSPPEQYGTSSTDYRTDIYSLGATLYAALTTTIPEDGLARMTGKAELTDIRELRPKINKRLADILDKALEVEPDDRFQSAAEFRAALIECGEMAAFFRERPTLAPPPQESAEGGEGADIIKPPSNNRRPSWPRPVSRARRRRRNVWVTGVAILFVAALMYLGMRLWPGIPRAVMAFVAPNATVWVTETTAAGGLQPEQTATPGPKETTEAPTALVGPAETGQVENLTPTETPTPEVVFTPTPTALGGGPAQIAFVSDRAGNFQIWMVNSDGKGLKQITNMRDGACQPAWSPDGMRLAFISPCISKEQTYLGSSIYLIDVDGSNLTPLPSSPEGDFDPAWSSDGKFLAFTSLRTGRPSIYTMNLETLDIKRLSSSNYDERQPVWSPMSRQLAFIRTKVFGQVWLMSDSGDQLNQFSVSGDFHNFFPLWSWDGSVIFYNQTASNSNVPWLMGMRYEDRKTSQEFRVPARGSSDIGPIGKVSLSPDGFWFAFESWPDGYNHDIYMMTVNGANRIRVTTDTSFDFGAAWRPVATP